MCIHVCFVVAIVVVYLVFFFFFFFFLKDISLCVLGDTYTFCRQNSPQIMYHLFHYPRHNTSKFVQRELTRKETKLQTIQISSTDMKCSILINSYLKNGLLPCKIILNLSVTDLYCRKLKKKENFEKGNS